MTTGLIFLIIAIVFIVVFVIGLSSASEADQNRSKAVIELKAGGFTPADAAIFQPYMILWDSEHRKVALIVTKQDLTAVTTVFDYEAIRDCEIVKDGQTVYKKSALRTIGGAVAGGVLLGGVGALIGGLSGGSRGRENITSLNLKLYFNSIDKPCESIPVITGATNGMLKADLVKDAEKWNDRFGAIIDENEKKAPARIIPQESSIEQIKQYKELFDSGTLTAEEFEQAKKKLLGI